MLVPEVLAEVVLITTREKANTLTSVLLSSGSFHPVSLDSSFPGAQDVFVQRTSFEISSKLKKLEEYLKELREFSPRVDESIRVEDWVAFSQELVKEISKLEAEADPLLSQIRESRQQASKLMDILKDLESVCSLDVELRKLSELNLFAVKIGEVPKEQVQSIPPLFSDEYFIVWQKSEGSYNIAVIALKEREKEVEKKLLSIGFKQLEVPEGLPQNPAAACEEIRERLEELEATIEAKKEELLKYREKIIELYAKAATAGEALKLLSLSNFTKFYVAMRGFVPSSELRRMEKALERALRGEYILFVGRAERGFRAQRAPSAVSVPKLLAPFKMLVDNYGAPKTSEVYPALMVAVTFPVIFALMFPDAGHGLLVMLFGFILMKKAGGREGWKNTGLLALYLGGASIVTGILAGEFFGPLTKLSEILWHGHPVLPTPFEGGASAVDIMINISLRLGATLLILGTFIGMLNHILSRDLVGMLTRGLPKFLAFTFALYPFVIYNAPQAGHLIYSTVFGGGGGVESLIVKYGAALGLLSIFIAEPLAHLIEHESGSLSSVLTMSFMEMFDTVLMMIGNTASFLRILGLSVAHAGLMYSFAVLAEMLMGGAAGTAAAVVVYAIGNLLAAGLEGIIVFAHSLRLHYYEWFSKFYSGSGIPFSPLRPALNILID